jgi:hypothetical protein
LHPGLRGEHPFGENPNIAMGWIDGLIQWEFREYPHKIYGLCKVQYLQFRILKWPLIDGLMMFFFYWDLGSYSMI